MKKDEFQKKYEDKLWVRVKVPATTGYLLGKQTKVELTSIRQYLGIKGVSTLKKEELVQVLSEALINRSEELFSELDEEQYHLVKHLVENGGLTDRFSLNTMQIVYLRDRGLVFPGIADGRKVLILPEDIGEAFKQLNNAQLVEQVQRNTYWVRLVRGLLYYYGVLSATQLTEELTNRQMIQLEDIPRFTKILDFIHRYYQGYNAFEQNLAHPAVSNPFALQKEQERKETMDFYPFTNEQLVEAGSTGFKDKNEGFQRFVRYLIDEFGVSQEKGEEITENCVLLTREGGSLQPLLDYLGEVVPLPDYSHVKPLIEEVVHLSNHTRQWVIKGYMPAELAPKNMGTSPTGPASVKIGRNDPCVCGSGKKYKKCCLNKGAKETLGV